MTQPRWRAGAFFIASPQGRVVPARTDLTRSFPGLAAAALEQLPVETIVDGEAVVGVNGRLDFAELQEAGGLTPPSGCPGRERSAFFLGVRPARPRRAGLPRPPPQLTPGPTDRRHGVVSATAAVSSLSHGC